MLKVFLGCWGIYWAVVALLPVTSLYPAVWEAFAMQAGFVLIVTFSYMAMVGPLGAGRAPTAGKIEIPASARIARVAVWMSVIGLLALIYDKVAIQGIVYSEGLATAREEWRRLGEERDQQASSIFSAVGYLLGSSYFVAVVLAVTQTRVLDARQRVRTMQLSFVLLMLNSAITGGRSNMLLLAGIVMIAFTARRGLDWSGLIPKASVRFRVKVLVALAAIYTVVIFYQRAEASDLTAFEYAIDFLPFLGLEAMDWYRDLISGSNLGSLSAMLVLALSYITHSFASDAAIMNGPFEDKTIIFFHAMGLLHKLGVVAAPDGEWFLVGRFVSVPGSLWHQYGVPGYLCGGVLMGAVAAACAAWTKRRPDSLLALGAYVMSGATLALSPALFAPDFLSFPFVVCSFIALAAVPVAKRRRSRRARAKIAAASLDVAASGSRIVLPG